jgi:hypothetical protein
MRCVKADTQYNPSTLMSVNRLLHPARATVYSCRGRVSLHALLLGCCCYFYSCMQMACLARACSTLPYAASTFLQAEVLLEECTSLYRPRHCVREDHTTGCYLPAMYSAEPLAPQPQHLHVSCKCHTQSPAFLCWPAILTHTAHCTQIRRVCCVCFSSCFHCYAPAAVLCSCPGSAPVIARCSCAAQHCCTARCCLRTRPDNL